jgi:uncharacterized protein YprB with RNaseH-like and TPR domain
VNPKILFFDIETSNLNANMGRILAFAYKYEGEKKVHSYNICNYPQFKKSGATDDWAICAEIHSILSNAEIICGHYSKKFDVPYINSRLLKNGLSVLPEFGQGHIDTWWYCKKKLKLTRNSLATAQSFFELEDEKTFLDYDVWYKAMCGDVESLRYIEDHCVKDILVLEQTFQRLRPLINIPALRLAKYKGEIFCTNCGSDNVIKHGTRYICPKKHYQRFLCHDCGAYFKGPEIKCAN